MATKTGYPAFVASAEGDISAEEDELRNGDDDALGAYSDEETGSGESAGDSGEGEGEPSGDVTQQIAHVSFGALQQAQNSLSRKRRRDSEASEGRDDKLEALRERLRQIRAEAKGANNSEPRSAKGRGGGAAADGEDSEEGDSNSDSDSAPSEKHVPSATRSSKHAPAAQSTRHQVSRKRQVIEVPKRVVRDPRFDALTQARSAHQGNSENAYSFLRDYQKSEVAELKVALKRTQSEEEKTILRRKINSMENKLKAKETKEREQSILRHHRKEEREKVQQGKAPYYLKRNELKERALVESFKGMKAKEREKRIEKKRRKESQRERRRMPVDRRMTG